ncbi:adenylate/guanylate cyclase domain-containing protein [uncultured Fibrobacter sp.]|uniref:adenylate/guanylate cyclase domain-containing protein n=1 Tax=uncultured Fibrobacter sp. TaxID=261512 RepID=UPI0026246F14|nr:adenylate/guanylate cyclase domain-containing protein [uncultured Fibrobacter sp.]
MEVKKRIDYDFISSIKRIDAILSSSDTDYSSVDYIPARSSFSYENGVYTKAIALFIDIIGSSNLTSSHTKPVIAKIYRSFISECTAILNAEEICEEININGDCVWGVFNAGENANYGVVFHVAARLNSLIDCLNEMMDLHGYKNIQAGIGIADGNVLIVKAGYPGSALNDLIWMGDAINLACHLASEAGRNGLEPILMTKSIVCRVNRRRQSLVLPTKNSNIYSGNFVATEMR